MSSRKPIARPRKRPLRRLMLVLGLLLPSASCVPDSTTLRPASLAGVSIALAPPAALLPPPAPESLASADAVAGAIAANLALPLGGGPNPAARPFSTASAGFGDQLRALDCLADALYYEARSEGEDGQRAVAQVVLNRVRHPAYPNSVCAVVYQGPQRAGSRGCQFTFTCDGSLARARLEPGWSRARRLAAEALAGRVYAPVGQATHYHSFAVFPHWASSLVKSAVVGAHIFYRWDGSAGQPLAFRQVYAGRERGRAAIIVPAAAPLPPATRPLLAYEAAAETAWTPRPPDTLPQSHAAGLGLPESRIREEYRNSGAWRDGAR